jgi:hypothetical protein
LTLLAALQAPAQTLSEPHFQGCFAQGHRENIQTVPGASEQLAKLAPPPPDHVRWEQQGGIVNECNGAVRVP